MRKIIFIVSLVLILLISGCIRSSVLEPSEEINEEGTWQPRGPSGETLPIVPVGPPYKYVTEKPKGWFKTGQKADIVIYGTEFNKSGGPLSLNHPQRITTGGGRLIIADTWNNRVLIWNKMPSENNELPDLVLGQPDFDSNIGRLGADGMNWPMGVATDGNKLLVADANNDRVLIWNEFPNNNGQPADLILGASDFDSWPVYMDWEQERNMTTRIYWPWDVWTDGEKIIVTSTTDASVLIWNTFPTENNQPADIILGHRNFSTRFADRSETPGYSPNPLVEMETTRSIASDSTRLIIGTYGENSMAYVWNEFPTSNGQPADFTLHVQRVETEPINGPVWGLDVDGNRLYLISDHQIYVWNEFPEKDKKEDFRLGSLDPELGNSNFDSLYDAVADGERLSVADTHNNRILIYNKIPDSSDAGADIIIGQKDFESDWMISRASFTNPTPFSDGEHLFVGSDLNGRAGIYNHLPGESKAYADIMVAGLALNQLAGDGERIIAADRGCGRILIWNEIPSVDNKIPDVILGLSTDLTQCEDYGEGRIGLNEPVGVTTDGKKLFVSDHGNNRVLIWNEIPTKSQTPADIVLGQPDFESTNPGDALNQFDGPMHISTDGERLVVADSNNRRVLVWNNIPLENTQPADFKIDIIDHSKEIGDLLPTAQISLFSGVVVRNNSLFVADTGNNRVLVWSEFPNSKLDEPDIVLGQPDFTSQYRTNSRDILFMPAAISFDGSYLWVGETKFSNRVLRFSVQPDATK